MKCKSITTSICILLLLGFGCSSNAIKTISNNDEVNKDNPVVKLYLQTACPVEGRIVGIGIDSGKDEKEALKNAKEDAHNQIATKISVKIYSMFEQDIKKKKTESKNSENKAVIKYRSQRIEHYSYEYSSAKIKDIREEEKLIFIKYDKLVYCRIVLSAVPDLTEEKKLIQKYVEEILKKHPNIDMSFEIVKTELWKLAESNEDKNFLSIRYFDKSAETAKNRGYDSQLEIFVLKESWISLIWLDDDGIEYWWKKAVAPPRPYVGKVTFSFSSENAKGKVTIIAIASVDKKYPAMLEFPFDKIVSTDKKMLYAFIAYFKYKLASAKYVCAKTSFNSK